MSRRGLFICALLASQVVACASQSSSTEDSSRHCFANFHSEGSFVAGTTYSTFEEHLGNRIAVFNQAIRVLNTEGYQVVYSDKDSGAISATNPVIFGKGTTATMSVNVTDAGQGLVRVSLSFTKAGFLIASATEVRSSFCDTLAQTFSKT